MVPIDALLAVAIDLPGRDSRRVGRELHRQLREAIMDGRLHSSLRLPSTRELAAALGVSRNTVIAAYDLLLSEGYVRAHGRGGTIVADFLAPRRGGRRGSAYQGRDPRLSSAWRAPPDVIPTRIPDDCRFDFGVGIPDRESFPHALWRRLAARALRGTTRAAFEYGEPQGRTALREAIAGHISFARAIACTAEEIVVTAGAQQAFDLLARILVAPGATVVVEEPGYPPLRNLLAAAGAKVVPIPVDDDGLQVDRIPAHAKVVCVTPSHQFPLGVRLSLARRSALLDFARKHGAVIIEDDYDGEFRFAGQPLDALQTLDRAGSVFYVGTFSKSLFPALRIGFVIAPPWAREALVAAKQLADWHTPHLPQDVLSAFIAEGHLARHVRKMQKLYGERREILRRALEHYGGERLRVTGIGAGLHLAAYLRDSIAAPALVDRARSGGIALNTIQRFAAVPNRASDGVVLGYGLIDAPRIVDAVRRLARLMQ